MNQVSALSSARIVVLNYMGVNLLPACVPSIVNAANKASTPTRITILNNPGPSSDDGTDYVRREFPEVDIVQAPENKILCSYNDYLPAISEDIVILLNNDIRVDPYFVDPLINKFREDEKTFLVTPCVMNFQGDEIQAGRSKSGIRFGLFWCDARYSGYEKDWIYASETDSSGFGAFSREKFIELGGYDDRFHPGIMEDVDLCYRAKKAGYRLYYEPQSVVHHMGQTSFHETFGKKGTAVLAHRNNFLFMWKNFKTGGFWFRHLLYLPLRLIFALLKGNVAMVLGFGQALRKLCK